MHVGLLLRIEKDDSRLVRCSHPQIMMFTHRDEAEKVMPHTYFLHPLLILDLDSHVVVWMVLCMRE